MKPRRGALAICGAGKLGLITGTQPEFIRYDDGSESNAWMGIHLTDTEVNRGEIKIGDPWSSRNPKVIGYLS